MSARRGVGDQGSRARHRKLDACPCRGRVAQWCQPCAENGEAARESINGDRCSPVAPTSTRADLHTSQTHVQELITPGSSGRRQAKDRRAGLSSSSNLSARVSQGGLRHAYGLPATSPQPRVPGMCMPPVPIGCRGRQSAGKAPSPERTSYCSAHQSYLLVVEACCARPAQFLERTAAREATL